MRSTVVRGAAFFLCLAALQAVGQPVRPDAGTILEYPQIPQLPPPGRPPAVRLPDRPASEPVDSSVVLVPGGFRVEGNTRFTDQELQQVLQPFVGQRQTLGDLVEAAHAVRDYYRSRGYILTEVYLPPQEFAASGGTVTISVLEGRVGRATVRVEGTGPALQLVERIVQSQLPSGELVTQYLLERPILLLRDLPGLEATAEVHPGANRGDADLVVVVKPTGPRLTGVAGADNHGSRAAGSTRAYLEAEAIGIAGYGDVLSARMQAATPGSGATRLYRAGYAASVGGSPTRLSLQLVHTDYALGGQFASLGAVGDAQVASLSATQPFIRSREASLFGAISIERKQLEDRTATPSTSTERRVDGVRLMALGNFIDTVGGTSLSSFALSASHGRLRMDSDARSLDEGPGGLNTAGTFWKYNLDVQRTMLLAPGQRLLVNLQGQLASRNLTSAEKIGLGGPGGVRGYPVGHALGDSGVVVNVEYRHQWGELAGAPLTGSLFYDWGRVRYDVDPLPLATSNAETLASAGLGLHAGAPGDYLFSLQLAWPTTSAARNVSSRRHPRTWLSLQKWL